MDTLVLFQRITNDSAANVYQGIWQGIEIACKRFESKTFASEAQIMAQLNHKNIVQFYGIYEQDQHYYLCMEKMEFGSLEDFFKKNKNVGLDQAKW